MEVMITGSGVYIRLLRRRAVIDLSVEFTQELPCAAMSKSLPTAPNHPDLHEDPRQ